ncbi:MAG: hypothetical protein HIU57_00375 [Acidobacteria bacterium]|nr:hypothetical protein [Acidobacteriota bacterium]
MVCRQRRPGTDLQRAGRSPRTGWYLGHGAGRGVWWCREGECAAGVNPARASRALRCALDENDAVALSEMVRRSKTVVVVEE